MPDLKDRFRPHVMNQNQIDLSNEVRSVIIMTATTLDKLPEGREKAIAYTKLEEALMWANKSIVLEEN